VSLLTNPSCLDGALHGWARDESNGLPAGRVLLSGVVVVGPGTAFTTRTEAEAGMKTVKVCESGGTVGGPAAPAAPVPRR
jgi:hypothetical protein